MRVSKSMHSKTAGYKIAWGLRGVAVLSVSLSVGCSAGEGDAAPKPPAVQAVVQPAAAPDKSDLTKSGKYVDAEERVFNYAQSGSLENPVCLAVEGALQDMSTETKWTAQVGRVAPFDVFRLDNFYRALHAQDQPFIAWENVPENEVNRADFAARYSQLGRTFYRDSEIKTSPGKMLYFQDYDEPMYWSNRHNEMSFDKFFEGQEEQGLESLIIRRAQLTNEYTLYDIQSPRPLTEYSEEIFLNWDDTANPFFSSLFNIQTASVSLAHDYKNGPGEISIIGSLTRSIPGEQGQYLAGLIWDSETLFAVTVDDNLRYKTVTGVIIYVTAFKPSEFATADTIRQNAILQKRRGTRGQVVGTGGKYETICRLHFEPVQN